MYIEKLNLNHGSVTVTNKITKIIIKIQLDIKYVSNDEYGLFFVRRGHV